MIKFIQKFCAAAYSESSIAEFVVFSSVRVMQQQSLQSLRRYWRYLETLLTETYITERVKTAASELKEIINTTPSVETIVKEEQKGEYSDPEEFLSTMKDQNKNPYSRYFASEK